MLTAYGKGNLKGLSRSIYFLKNLLFYPVLIYFCTQELAHYLEKKYEKFGIHLILLDFLLKIGNINIFLLNIF